MGKREEQLQFTRSLLELGAYEKAVKILEDVLKNYPSEKSIVHMLAEAHTKYGTLEKRKAFFESVRHLGDSHLITSLGDTYGALGRYDFAIEAYREALTLDERDGHIWFILGRTYEMKKAFEDAVNAYQKSLIYSSRKPWECDCYLYLADTYRKAGKLDPAKATYRKALNLFPLENRLKSGLKSAEADPSSRNMDSATFFLNKTLQESWADQFARVLFVCLKTAIQADGKILKPEQDEFNRIMLPLKSLLPDWSELDKKSFTDGEIKRLVSGLPSEARVLILEYVAQIVAIDKEWDSQEEKYFRKLVDFLEIEGKTGERIRFTHIPIEWKYLEEQAEKLEFGDITAVENLVNLWDRYWNTFWSGNPPKIPVIFNTLKNIWGILEFRSGDHPSYRVLNPEKARELRTVIRQEFFSRGAYGAQKILSDMMMESVCRLVLRRSGVPLATRMTGMIFLNRGLLALDTFQKMILTPDWKEEGGNRPLYVTILERPSAILSLMEEIHMQGLG